MDSLEKEADRIEKERPEQARAIRENVQRIRQTWEILTQKVREHEAKLDEAGDLQRFLRDLDHFQMWLSNTQREVASEDEPQSLAEAEQLLNQHSAIREEIDGYAEDYAKMRAMGDRVTQDQTDPQYLFLRKVNTVNQLCERVKKFRRRGSHNRLYNDVLKSYRVPLDRHENYYAFFNLISITLSF